MERDINVVAHVKDNGSVSFTTGDGLPIQLGGGEGGGTKLYKHILTLMVKSPGNITVDKFVLLTLSELSFVGISPNDERFVNSICLGAKVLDYDGDNYTFIRFNYSVGEGSVMYWANLSTMQLVEFEIEEVLNDIVTEWSDI